MCFGLGQIQSIVIQVDLFQMCKIFNTNHNQHIMLSSKNCSKYQTHNKSLSIETIRSVGYLKGTILWQIRSRDDLNLKQLQILTDYCIHISG